MVIILVEATDSCASDGNVFVLKQCICVEAMYLWTSCSQFLRKILWLRADFCQLPFMISFSGRPRLLLHRKSTVGGVRNANEIKPKLNQTQTKLNRLPVTSDQTRNKQMQKMPPKECETNAHEMKCKSTKLNQPKSNWAKCNPKSITFWHQWWVIVQMA